MSKLKMYTATAKECTKTPLTQTLFKKTLYMFLCTFLTDFVYFSNGNAYGRRHILYIVDLLFDAFYCCCRDILVSLISLQNAKQKQNTTLTLTYLHM